MISLAIFALPLSSYAAETKGAGELNELLRGAISAVETYNQALEKFGTSSSGAFLRSAKADHEAAVAEIRELVTAAGGTPVASSGAWGTWAEAVTGAAKALGEEAALKILKEGEEHGIKEYDEVLQDAEVPASLKASIRSKYIPQQKAHIAAIDKIMQAP